MFIMLEGTRVILEHYAPKTLSEDIKSLGIITDAQKPAKEKENGVLHYDTTLQKFYYDYHGQSEIDELKQTVADLTEIVLNGGIV